MTPEERKRLESAGWVELGGKTVAPVWSHPEITPDDSLYPDLALAVQDALDAAREEGSPGRKTGTAS